jgi:hypothetical protein
MTLIALASMRMITRKSRSITVLPPLEKVLSLNPNNLDANELLKQVEKPYDIDPSDSPWPEIREALELLILKDEKLEYLLGHNLEKGECQETKNHIIELKNILKENFDINKIFAGVPTLSIVSWYLRCPIEEKKKIELIELIHWILDQGAHVRTIYAEATNLMNLTHSCQLSNIDQTSPLFQTISKLIQLVKDRDRDLTEEYLSLKTLGNLLGINSPSLLGPSIFPLCGISIKLRNDDDFFSGPIKEAIVSILDEMIVDSTPLFSVKEKQKLNHLNGTFINILKKCKIFFPDPFNQFTYTFRIDATTNHVTSFIYQQPYLVLGNSTSSLRGTYIFKVNSDKFHKEDKNQLTWLLPDCSTMEEIQENLEKFYNQDYFQKIEANHLIFIPQKKQKQPNCPWKAAQLSLFAIFFLSLADHKLESKTQDDVKYLSETAHLLTKIVCREIKARQISSYITFHHSLRAYPPDPAILDKAQKFAVKINRPTLLDEIHKLKDTSIYFTID